MALTDNLVSYYSLNGHTNDLVGTNDGTNHGATSTTGKIGGAYNFDGSNDYIDSNSNVGISGTQPRTISFWAKANALNNKVHIVNYGSASINNAFGIWVNTDNKIYFYGHGGSEDYYTGINLDTNWHFYIITYDGSYVDTYIDGSATPTTHQARTLATTSTKLYIGTRVDIGYYWHGIIDEVGVWDRALTSSEVSELYNSGNGKTYFDGQFIDSPDLREEIVSYYKFDETSGTTAADSVGSNTMNLHSVDHTTGKIGEGLSINADADNMTPTTAFNQTNISFSFWYYYGGVSSGGWNSLIVRDGGSYHHCLINASSHEIGFYNSGFYSSGYSLTIGNWYHIVVVKEGTNEKIYVNNDLKLNSSSSFNNSSYNASVFLNYKSSGGTQGARGTFDELGIWNRALSASEVNDLYNNGDGFSYPFINAKIQSLSDSLTFNDSILTDVTKIININENMSMIDILTENMVYTRIMNDTLSLTDSILPRKFKEGIIFTKYIIT